MQTLTTTFKTLIGVNASSATALRRGKLYDLMVGTNVSPADQYMQYDVSRMTAAGTGTSATINALDGADTSILTVGSVNYTAEPTVTANSSLINIGVNQRASYRWVAAPGSELVWPATNLAGLVCRALSGGSPTSTATVMCQEQ